MAGEIKVDRAIRGKLRSRELDLLIGWLADNQHGVVGRTQLLAFGASPDAIDRRIAAGRLRTIHRGVYAVGHRRLTQNGWWMAGVLAGGEGAVLSHVSAAALWELPAPQRGGVHVTAPRRHGRRKSLTFHWTHLAADETTEKCAIPVTTVARTMLDLASMLTPHQVERAMREAEYRRLADSTPLGALLDRHPRARGIVALRRTRELDGLGEDRVETNLEEEFIAFCDERSLPRPRTNLWLQIGGVWIRADCAWPEHRLIVELDDRASHDRTRAFESDRQRDRRLLAAGWRSARVTGRHLRHQRDELHTDLRAIIDRWPAQ